MNENLLPWVYYSHLTRVKVTVDNRKTLQCPLWKSKFTVFPLFSLHHIVTL